METLALVWIVVGMVLMVLELLIPGAVFGFIGAAAIITGGLIHFGHLNGMLNIMMTFFATSFIFIIVLRSVLLKFFPDNSIVENTDEVQDAIGSLVLVSETITSFKTGRIKYLDTDWEAQAETEIVTGDQAIITGRDGNCWIVKSIEGS